MSSVFKIFVLISLTLFSLEGLCTPIDPCVQGRIKYYFNNKEVIEPAVYCKDTLTGNILSENCFKNKKCAAVTWMSKSLEFPPENLSSVGSPDFKLCKAASGVPQIMEYWDAGHWVSTSRCIFEKDKSFVEGEYLFHLIENQLRTD